jgi:DNA repair exonuclease SbcCD nuclease subunit
MKIMASGDHHFDEHSRFQECIRVHGWIADEVARQRPAAFLSGGDIYERASTPNERAAVAEWLTAVAETCPVVIARGNHDRQRDCELLARLRTRHPVIVEERCGVHVVGGVAVAAVGWPNRASIAHMIGKPLPPEAVDDVARELLSNVVRGLGQELITHAGPRVLLTHAMINGSITSVGQPLIGAEMNVGLDNLALSGADIAIAAHIHKPQEWQFGKLPIAYTGSPFRTAFGEVEEKSILLAEFGADGRLVQWSRLTTPATQMILIEAKWDGEGASFEISSLAFPSCERVNGAEVRFRYRVDANCRDAAKRAATELRARMTSDGAVSVKCEEEVMSTTRARAPEVAAAKTIDDKLVAFWRSRGLELKAQRIDALLTKFHLVEEEVAAA